MDGEIGNVRAKGEREHEAEAEAEAEAEVEVESHQREQERGILGLGGDEERGGGGEGLEHKEEGQEADAHAQHAAALVLQRYLRQYCARLRFGDLMFSKYLREEEEKEEEERKRMANSLHMLESLKLRQAMDQRFQAMPPRPPLTPQPNGNEGEEERAVELPPHTSAALQRAVEALAPEMADYKHAHTPHQLPFALVDEQGHSPAQSRPKFETLMVPVDHAALTQERISQMHTNELRDLARFLSGLVKSRFHTLLSELQRREELKDEGEVLNQMIHDLVKRLTAQHQQ